jgi:NAD(P)H-hydrate epimerase
VLVATAADIRALDLEAITELGIPGAVLMEAAGRGAAEHIAGALEERRIALRDLRVGILCGAGNNGGDGYVIARYLSCRGALVRVYQCAPRSKEPAPGDDAAQNLAILRRLGGVPVIECTSEARLEEHRAELASEEVLVDALLGTGTTRNVSGAIARAIAIANTSQRARLRVAIDLPSGLHADSGAILGEAFGTDLTITFGAPKLGLVSWPGCERTGRLVTVDIGIPPQLVARKLAVRLLEAADVAPLIPARPAGAHKGTFGHVLVIAGEPGKTGAALLAARAAQRAGAGLVTIAASPGVRGAVEARVLECMTDELAGPADLTRLAERKTALVVGPGLGISPEAEALLLAALELTLPVVIDADGLSVLATSAACRSALLAAGVRAALTPHPAEAARLLGCTTAEVQHDRAAAARRLAAELGAPVALKGARTMIAHPDGSLAINPTGGPALATGGTGDVLAGAVAALCGQGLTSFDALCLATYVHGATADSLIATRGVDRGILAGEVADALPAIFFALQAAGLSETRTR